MSSSTPPRKFAPTPVEQTTRSSRQPDTPEEDKKKPRRFAPEPVQETTRSSKDARQQPAELEKPKPRRFAPEPMEHSSKSSKDMHMKDAEEVAKPTPRRFAPQMVEDVHMSSKDKERAQKPHVKFMPEPISTTYSSNRKTKRSQDSDSSAMDLDEKGPRKFTPILLDTARRSRRAGDDRPVLSQSDKTEYGYHVQDTEHWKRVNNERAGAIALPPPPPADEDSESDRLSAMSTDQSTQFRQPSPLDGSAPQRSSCLVAPARLHSFRMPDLDTIESSESEPDRSPSPVSSSPGRDGSPITAPASESSYEHFKHATRIRESIDESFTHYLLDLERKNARQRLEMQALAAYPNPDFSYEAPNHYINNDDDSEVMEIEDRPVTWEGNDDDEDMLEVAKPRRESTEGEWEQAEMQRHVEQIHQERNALQTTVKKRTEPGPWWKPPVPPGQADAEPMSEIKSMRDRARPPMLGNDIVFPRCSSPEPARFDVTQGSTALRNQMCYLSEAADQGCKRTGEDAGLWSAPHSPTSPVSWVKSPPSSAKTTQSKGLWGGFCVDDAEKAPASAALAPPPGPTGLMTPKREGPDPFELAFRGEKPLGMQTPPTPPGKATVKVADFAKISAVLTHEREIEEMLDREYPDSFITQVYNYLSLGYPSLARDFDEELSKISHYSIQELRQDDQTAKASPRGYIRLGTDFEGGGGEGMSEDRCMRWQALKRYIREWARQEKNMVKSEGDGNWGTGARRGSWAF